jgi:hypothetical protein
MGFNVDWPSGPWRYPNGIHVRPEFASFETDLTRVLVTLRTISYLWLDENQIAQNQHDLNSWEGRIQRFPQERGNVFREVRRSGETKLILCIEHYHKITI